MYGYSISLKISPIERVTVTLNLGDIPYGRQDHWQQVKGEKKVNLLEKSCLCLRSIKFLSHLHSKADQGPDQHLI
ncbi:hypothetical protein Y1Q_0015675 [Alligator mississippiensis]|uniref:Uncharacterized protein n=1 Tax=Alligator mississippiensis TaxID=8496 RepID=A0A151NNL3_ALLMI|nr:hypothetical protein Y1Q_0015675 [Alligator mississippiensis]